MEANRKWLLLVVLLLAFGTAVSGCGKGEEDALEAPSDSTDGIPAEVPGTTNDTKTGDRDSSGNPQPKKDLSISSQGDPDPSADASGSDNRKDNPADYNIAEPFDKARPTLMGFSIGDTADAVIARFGKPLAETSMNDGQFLKVLEYPGFRFGADENQAIVFIEVMTDQVMPGLNQFRLGQTVDEAQKALGPADTLNDYVMIYQFDGVVLKCDLNPNNRTVIAIRLFAS